MIPPVAKDSTYHKQAPYLEHANVDRCAFDFVAKEQNGSGHVLHDNDTDAIPVDLV
jgi:hypothetical protein